MSKKNRKVPRYMSNLYMSDVWKRYQVTTCHEAKWVKVGGHAVYLCGYVDLKAGVDRAIAGLDVFIALDDVWDNEVRKVNISNPLMARLAKKLKHGIPNIFVHHVTDHSISPLLAKEVTEIVLEGHKVGFGCFGGHGRAGWLLGHLLREIEGLEGQGLINAIRTRWCSEALEGKIQYESLGLLDYWIQTSHTYFSGGAKNVPIRYDMNTGTWKQVNDLEVKRQTTLTPNAHEEFIEVKCDLCGGKDKKCIACDGEGTVIETMNRGGWTV